MNSFSTASVLAGGRGRQTKNALPSVNHARENSVNRSYRHYAEALLNRGRLRRRLGDVTGGDADISRAVQLDPKLKPQR